MGKSKTRMGLGQPVRYRVRIRGELDLEWSDWLSAERIFSDNGYTIIIGLFTDQTALHSLLGKLRDLGVPLVSVCQMNTEDPD